jgi:hypothetical protein
MNITLDQLPRQPRRFFTHVVPPVYILAVLFVDYKMPIGTITPFFVVMGLLTMALTFQPGQMIPWAIVYTTVTCSIFLSPRLHVLFTGHPFPDQFIVPWIRAATYVAVGFLSCYLCFVLNRLRRAQYELALILDKLPSAILVSDQNGRILYSNDASRDMIPDLEMRRSHYSFFELLASPQHQGRSISEYLHRLERNDHESPMDLSIYGRPLNGETRVIDWMGERVLLTIVSKVSLEEDPIEIKKSA